MPHGGWVAFEKNEVHDCKGPTKAETPNPPLRKPLPISEPIEFPDIEVPDDPVTGQGIKSRTEKPKEEGLPPVPGPRPRPPAPTIPSEPANRRPAPVQSLPKRMRHRKRSLHRQRRWRHRASRQEHQRGSQPA